MPEKTRAQKKQIRRTKRNVKKGKRLERASKRKATRASSLTNKSKGTGRKYGRGQRLQQEASNFKAESKPAKRSGSKPAKRVKMQVTKRSAAKDKYRKDPAYRYSSAGRKIAKAVKREDKRKARKKK